MARARKTVQKTEEKVTPKVEKELGYDLANYKNLGVIKIRSIEVKHPLAIENGGLVMGSKVYMALEDRFKGKFKTGLSKEDIKYLNDHLGFKEDLNDSVPRDISDYTFWRTTRARVRLDPGITVLDRRTALGFIHWKLALENEFIANSAEAYDKGEFPEATHIIFDERIDIERKATKIQFKQKVLVKTLSLSNERKKHLLMILTNVDYTNLSDNKVSIGISDLIEKRPYELSELIDKDAEYITYRSNVLRALAQNVLQKRGLQILFKGANIGADVDKVVESLRKPDNQEIYQDILDNFK